MLGPGGRSTKQREQQTHRRGGISPLRKRRAPRTEERERVFFNSRFHELNLGETPVLNFNSGLPELNLDENPVLYGDSMVNQGTVTKFISLLPKEHKR